MMSSQDKQTYDDRLLVRYLLGALSAEESQRLDEMSVTEEELAARLNAVEHDLVDSYARGELTGDDLAHFESFYLASARRRQKVEFAAALVDLEKRPAAAPARATQEPTSGPMRKLAEPRTRPAPPLWQWGFAVAAVVMLCVAGFLLSQNQRLRRDISNAQEQQMAGEQRAQELQGELSDQRAAHAESLKEIERLRQPSTNVGELRTVAVFLPAPTRGAARIPTLALHAGTDVAVMFLALEADDFPSYRAALKDPATAQIFWTSGTLASSSLGQEKAVSISFPASLLKQQTYIVELTGLPTRRAPEPVGEYPFRVALK